MFDGVAPAAGASGRPVASIKDTESTAYDAGLRAFQGGKLMSSCPYPQRSALYHCWMDGWFDMSHAMDTLPDD